MDNKRKPYLRRGYIAYYNSKNNNYDYEHDIVIKKYENHNLKKDEVVHHLDCNKVNNNPENLIYLNISQHGKLHGWINKGCPISKKNITNIKTALNESRRCRLSTCNNIVKDTRNLYCSIDCRQKDIDTNNIMWRAKSNDNEIKKWPDTDTLINKVNQQGYVKTAKELGVSDKAIAKRLDKFNRRNEIKDFRKNCKKK